MKKLFLSLFILLGLTACKQNQSEFVLNMVVPCPRIDSTYVGRHDQPIVCKKDDNTFINGKMTEYFVDGQIHRLFNISTGIPDGSWKCYYENDNLISEFSYKNGKVNGTMKNYYMACNLHVEQVYKNGQKITNETIYIYPRNENTQKAVNKNNLIRQPEPHVEYMDGDILIDKFKSNIVAFNKEYENKTIKAYGKIERIGVYGSDVYVMVGNAYTGIKCIAKNKDLVADLRQGENIKFYGTYKSNPYINIDMELENCVINRF